MGFEREKKRKYDCEMRTIKDKENIKGDGMVPF